MNKSRSALAALGLSVLLLSGCSVLESFNNSVNNAVDPDNWTSESTSAVASLNRYTDLINSAHEQMQYLDSDVSYFESDMNDGIDPYFTCTFELYDRESLEADTTNPSGIDDTEAQDLIAQATAIFATIDTTTELCKELDKYVTAQDYKTDDYAQGKTLVADLYTHLDTYYDQHDTLLATVDGLYDKYDTWTVDLSDPISVGIDNMDKDLEIADELLTLVEDSVTAGTYEKMTEVQTAYDNLTTAMEAHTGDNAPAIDSAYTYNYTDFYDTLEVKFLPTIKRALRDMEAQDLDALTTDYYDVLDNYNLMVDSYNYFLESTGY